MAQRYSDAVVQCVVQCLRVLTVSSCPIVSLYDIISWYLEIVRPLLFPTAKNLAKYMKSCIERINAHSDQFPADPPLVSHFVSQHCSGSLMSGLASTLDCSVIRPAKRVHILSEEWTATVRSSSQCLRHLKGAMTYTQHSLQDGNCNQFSICCRCGVGTRGWNDDPPSREINAAHFQVILITCQIGQQPGVVTIAHSSTSVVWGSCVKQGYRAVVWITELVGESSQRASICLFVLTRRAVV